MNTLSSENVKLAGSLATVAIAALGGPLAATGAALGEVVKHASGHYQKQASTRELQNQVKLAVTGWAGGEHFGADSLRLGLALALETVARAGLDLDAVIRRHFNSEAITREVVAKAQAEDPQWGKENHYSVAEHAIAETYAALVARLMGDVGSVIPTLEALRASITDHADQLTVMGRHLGRSLDALVETLVADASAADVMSYLQACARDWDRSV